MSEPYSPNSEPKRPQYGLPGTGAPQQGQQSQQSPEGQPPAAPQFTNSDVNSSANDPYSSQPSQGSGNDYFGGYGNTASSGSGTGPAKKQKPVGIILTVIGAIITLIGGALFGVGIVKTINTAVNATPSNDAPTGEFSGSTSTADFTISELEMLVIYVPQGDSNAKCTATMEDGTTLPTQSLESDDTAVSIGGKNYVLYVDAPYSETASGSGTVTCENVSGPVVLAGPVGVMSTAGWVIGGVFGGLIIGVLGLLLLIAGIITMLVRAAKRKKAVA